VTITDKEWKTANDKWLADLKAGKFKKQRSDVDKVAAALEVEPPPLPLSPEGQRNTEIVLREPITENGDESSERPLTSTRSKILALVEWAEAQAWTGRGGATDHQAYLAFLGAAYGANTLLVDMSQYRLAETIGVSHTTAWRAMRRLEQRGLLRPEDRASVHKGVTYSSDAKIVSSSYLLTNQEGVHRRVTYTPTPLLKGRMSHSYAQVPEAFMGRSGLSKAALHTYRLLDPTKGQSEKELAEKLGRNRSSVNRTLRQLAKLDLAHKGPEGWILGSASLEEVAEILTTTGAAGRMRAYHESLREGYRAYLKHKESTSAASPSAQDVQAREGTVVSTAGEVVSNDRRAALPKRSAEPVSSDHGRGVSSEPMEGLGYDSADLLPDDRSRQSVGGMAVGNRSQPQGREAACVDCGQVQTFSAPDLKPYSCAYCKGKFVFVDELAMAVA
jgi:predicted transcriptional regulator